jgi:5-methylcytosine-specific restriction endonuclease McrA
LTLVSSAPVCELCGSASRTPTASGSLRSIGPVSRVIPTSGKYQPLRKLTNAQVVESVALYQAGLSLSKVAARMGVSRQAMHDLLKRRIVLRGRIEALPRKSPTAIRQKRAATLKRYRARAARITRSQILAVFERDRTCRTCGDEATDVDHVLPVAHGGQTTLDNLQALCRPCHTAKTRMQLKGVV